MSFRLACDCIPGILGRVSSALSGNFGAVGSVLGCDLGSMRGVLGGYRRAMRCVLGRDFGSVANILGSDLGVVSDHFGAVRGLICRDGRAMSRLMVDLLGRMPCVLSGIFRRVAGIDRGILGGVPGVLHVLARILSVRRSGSKPHCKPCGEQKSCHPNRLHASSSGLLSAGHTQVDSPNRRRDVRDVRIRWTVEWQLLAKMRIFLYVCKISSRLEQTGRSTHSSAGGMEA